MAKPKFTAAQVANALDKHKGMVYLAAEALGCSHNTVYNYAKRHPTVQEAIDRNRGHVVDTAELALYNAILSGEHWAVTFALKTIGKDRGYTERSEQEISGAGGGPVKFQIDMGELSDDELRRIADGEDPAHVLATKGQGGAGTEATDG